MDVREMQTKPKNAFNRGMEHEIYSSLKNPDMLFKVGELDVINEWYEVFKSDPQIFPVVYRIGKIPVKNVYYVGLEKLDTDKFQQKWNQLELSLEEIGALDVDRGETFSDLYMNEGLDAEVFKQIAKNLVNKDRNSYNFFVEFLTVIKKCERAIYKVMGKDTIVDVHKYNFGYSKDGKLKCLDI